MCLVYQFDNYKNTSAIGSFLKIVKAVQSFLVHLYLYRQRGKSGKEGQSLSEDIQLFKTLWMLEYYNGSYYSLQPFYALSQEDVEKQVQEWIEQQLPTKITRKSLRAFPGGFKIFMSELPGKIPVTTR